MKKISRKDKKREKEMSVMTEAKRLSRYIFDATEKSPRKYSFSLINRMQNTSLDIVDLLYDANDVFIDIKLLNDLRTSISNAQKQLAVEKNEERIHHLENKLLTLKLIEATKFEERVGKRLDAQYKAKNMIKRLEHLVTIAAEKQCIRPNQRELIGKYIKSLKDLLGKWISSDKKRYKYN